jgi:Ni/Co efflux regulator RcnB
MRKLLISLLLASAAATPALADPPSKADREQAREERQQAREQRQQSRDQSRSERSGGNAPQVSPQSGGSGHAERVSPQGGTDRAQSAGYGRPSHVNVPEQGLTGGGPKRGNAGAGRQDRAESRRTDSDYVAPGPKIVRPSGQARSLRESRADNREQLRQDRIEARELRQSTRPLPPVMRTRTPVVSKVPREGTQPPPRVDNRRSSTPTWSTNWRHNNKYDWHDWRKRHRSRFHLGFYYDPFGWGYSPYQIGWRLWPSYYSSRYWISDPWEYRLPYAPPGYRWIRYWNDAVLVDTWSGQVVDVIHNFFW